MCFLLLCWWFLGLKRIFRFRQVLLSFSLPLPEETLNYPSKNVLPIFSSEFYSFSLTFKSLIYFEVIAVCGVRKLSNLILLYVAVQFPIIKSVSNKHSLLKRLSCLHWIFLLSFSVIDWTDKCGFIPGLCILLYPSIPSIHFCVSITQFLITTMLHNLKSGSIYL